MAYRNKTYICFDGDTDMNFYRIMLAWKENEKIDFNFYNAHDLNFSYDSSQTESIKKQLRERMSNSKQMIVLVGKHTRLLRKFVPWEIELARKHDIPIVCANLNMNRKYDSELCPKAITESNIYTLHISFNARIIKLALDYFPNEYAENKKTKSGQWFLPDEEYRKLGL